MKTRQNELETISDDSVESDKEKSLLHIRRLDWRFLLPEIKYQNIAYLGKPDKELLDVLKHIFGEAQVLELGDLEKENNESFDLVVLNGVGIEDVKLVAPLMKPEGVLYWEVNRLGDFKSGWGSSAGINKFKSIWSFFSMASSYVRILTQSGFLDVESYWHRPDFLTCKEIIPLHESAALNHVFSNNAGNGLKRFKFMIGRTAMRLGLLNVLAPCFSLVAVKQSETENI